MLETNIIFEVETRVCKIKTTERYWEIIKDKHPEVKDLLSDIINTLKAPDQIRKSKIDSSVYLFYGKIGKYWLSIVTKKLNGEGFIITAYLTNKIKEGETIWAK